MTNNINKGNVPHWKLCANEWKTLSPPLVMHKGEAEIYKEFIVKYCSGKNAILFGATPQLRDLLYELGFNVTLVDINEDMIKAMDSLLQKSDNNENKIVGNWLDINKTIKFGWEFDLALGDHFLCHITFDKYPEMFRIIKSILTENGVFIANTALRIIKNIDANKLIDLYRDDNTILNDIQDKIMYLYQVLGNDQKIYLNSTKQTNWIELNKVLKEKLEKKQITFKEYNTLLLKESASSDDTFISFITKEELIDSLRDHFDILNNKHIDEHDVYKHHQIFAMCKIKNKKNLV